MVRDYIVLDLEMTGLNPRTDAILEVGAVKIQNGVETEVFKRLVCPQREIEPKIQEITGITNEIASEGEELDVVMNDFIAFLDEDVIVGHNIIFDYSFLKQWAINKRIAFEKKAVDTLKIARFCLPDLEKKTLEYLCGHYGIVQKSKHRALSDARATQLLYQCLAREFMEKSPEIFVPRQLEYKAKRQTSATDRQKKYLKELSVYHKIELELSFNTMTRSEASRYTDRIISQYGRMDAKSQNSVCP